MGTKMLSGELAELGPQAEMWSKLDSVLVR